MSKRSWTVRGHIVAHLHVRECLAPEALEPATALVPDSDAPSRAGSKPPLTPSPEPQAAKISPQISSQQEKSQQTQQTDSEQTDSEQTDSEQTDSEQADSGLKESQHTDSEHTDSQSANGASQVDFKPATPDAAAELINYPIIVQGQTVPANGKPITVNNQPVIVSSGYLHVGTLSTPIPEAQVTPQAGQPIVAGTLTFHPASPSPVAQVVPSPFVVGGLTFSAAQSEPSTESNKAPNQPQARPVVVGGKMYAPIVPASESNTSQEAGKAPEPANTQEQPNNAVNNEHSVPAESGSQPEQADSKPIVIGDMTYTPVTTSATPSPQHAAVFSFGGTALTQGGDAITISGTRISLGRSGVLIGTSSLPFSTASTPTSLLTINSQTLTALRGSGGGFEMNHSTLLPGSPGISISGTIYSINAAGSLIVGTSTIPLATTDSSNATDTALTAAGKTFTPLGSTAVVVDGTTLSMGGSAMTEKGTRLSLASNGLVVGSSTFAYATPTANTASASGLSGTFSTGVLPGGGATPAAIPSATGGVYRSAASAKGSVANAMSAVIGVLTSLYVMT